MEAPQNEMPWVSFCMSTFKRPLLLKTQLHNISKQTFLDYEVVISDNDPASSGEQVVIGFKDDRIRYFSNDANLGMIRSFNKSIERARGQYVVMITDDDPVVPEMLDTFSDIIKHNPGFGIYCGCERTGLKKNVVETFDKFTFVFQLLHPERTGNLLWSSCLLDRQVLINTGGMPDYGSPHLADHAMLALCGSVNGGIMINKMFSQLTSHNDNFSKTNIELYYIACRGFYALITSSFEPAYFIRHSENALLEHLGRWFITYSFSLRRYYTQTLPDKQKVISIDEDARKVMSLPFMKWVRRKYTLKLVVFKIKILLVRIRLLK